MTRKNIARLLLLPFVLLTVYAVYMIGYIGVFDYQLHSPSGWQVMTDLVIACLIILMWMIPEARRNGRNPWPYVVITVFLGSIGPLLYLATDKDEL